MTEDTQIQERTVPAWVVIIDNAPTAVMFILGAVLIGKIGPVFAVLYFAYCLLSVFLFWYRICPWCRHFGTSGCPCGYGKISAGLFKSRSGKDFKKVFKRNIGIVFPCWILPFGVGIYLLVTGFSGALLSLFLSFCIVGFVLIPVISKYVGCKSCTLKHDCPWMS